MGRDFALLTLKSSFVPRGIAWWVGQDLAVGKAIHGNAATF